MSENVFKGTLVQLAADDPQKLADLNARWNQDSEYSRLLSDWVAHLFSAEQARKWIEKQEEHPDQFNFSIRRLDNEETIGEIGLDGIRWNHRDTFVGIGIGDRDLWGKGFGTDAMRTILRYAFLELNLERVSLNVYEYNPRGVKSYEKCGFQLEGRVRQALLREGQRWDVIYMGILRQDWLAANPPAVQKTGKSKKAAGVK